MLHPEPNPAENPYATIPERGKFVLPAIAALAVGGMGSSLVARLSRRFDVVVQMEQVVRVVLLFDLG